MLFGWMERMMWIVEVVQRVLSEHVLDQKPKRMLISKQKFMSASLELAVTLCALFLHRPHSSP